MNTAPREAAPAAVPELRLVEARDRARLPAVDATRGLALLLMVLDHVATFARANVTAETNANYPVHLWGPGWFITGLVTNVSSPTFWFLAGVSIALLVARERHKDSTDDFLLVRAGALFLIDMVLMGWEWMPLSPPHPKVAFDLLSCIAFALLLMIPVRRLPDRWLAGFTALLFVGFSVLTHVVPQAAFEHLQFPLRPFLAFDATHAPIVTFPVLGWLGVMTLGLWCGRRLADGRWTTGAPFARVAWIGLGVWLLARLTGIGSAGAWRPAAGLEALFLMQKGPPTLDFLAFNLAFGLFALALALDAGSALERRAPERWLVVLGRAPLFLFVIHLLVAFACARFFTHVFRHATAPRYAAAFVCTAAILLPLARWYRGLKDRYPDTLIHFL